MRCGSYISAKLGDHDSVGDAEIILGAWILHRDLCQQDLSMKEIPYFACPQLIANAGHTATKPMDLKYEMNF